MTIDRFDIYVDFDGFVIVEAAQNGDFVKAEDAPAHSQRVTITQWGMGDGYASITVDDDNDGEWVRFEDI